MVRRGEVPPLAWAGAAVPPLAWAGCAVPPLAWAGCAVPPLAWADEVPPLAWADVEVPPLAGIVAVGMCHGFDQERLSADAGVSSEVAAGRLLTLTSMSNSSQKS